MEWKKGFCAGIGMLGGLVSAALGGWDQSLAALVALMAVDYATGLLVAGVFHASPKSRGGGLESGAGWKGLARKAVTVMLVAVGHVADLLLGSSYVRDAVVIGFAANEAISIVENAGLMGLPIPEVVIRAVDVLRSGESGKEPE